MAQSKPQSTFDEIVASIGSLDDIEVYGNRVLVGIYIPPEKTAGGIILTDKQRDENQYQGKVAVVLKKGPLAFENDRNVDFKGQDVKVGDWAVYRISDGFPLDVRGVHCRLLEDTDIRMRVTDPLMIY